MGEAEEAARLEPRVFQVLSEHNGFGVASSNGSTVTIQRGTLAGNTVGADVEGGTLFINESSISGNGTGLSQISPGTLQLANSNVTFNTTGISGTVQSYTNNRFSNNGGGGTITAIGTTSNPTGQQ